MKMIKNIFLVLIFIICLNTIIFAQDTNDFVNPTPKLKLSDSTSFNFQANTEQTLELKLSNITSFYAYNILIQSKFAAENPPFTLEFLENTNNLHSIQGGGSAKIKVNVKIDKNAAPGTYPITLNYSYTSKDFKSHTGDDTLLFRIENKNTSPLIEIIDFKTSKENVIAGEDFNISATLKNIGDLDAKNVTVTLSGLTSDGISIKNNVNSTFFKEYGSDFSNPLSFSFKSQENMKSGVYPIKFKVTYYDLNNKELTREYDFHINIISKDEQKIENPAILSITDVVVSTKVFTVGEIAPITFNIKNTGLSNAKNIKITAKPEEGINPTSSNVVALQSIKPNETRAVNFNFSPASTAKSKNYSIGFDVEYETGSKNTDGTFTKNTFSQYVGINVTNPEKDKEENKSNEDFKKSSPKIIISQYKSTPTIVEAGNSFDLTLTFQNTHSTKTIKNIKSYFTVDEKTEEKGNVFSPDNSTNTLFIDEIKPKGFYTYNFKMFTVPDAQPKTYKMNVNFEYDDQDGNPLTSTEIIGINVKQPTKLEISNLNLPETAMMYENVGINFELYNTGKVTLSNVIVKLESKSSNFSSSQFIGNLSSGNIDYFDGSFIPEKAGSNDLKITISYDDTDNKTIEVVNDFSINVSENSEDVFLDTSIDTTYSETSTNKGKIIAISCSIILIIFITSFVIYKKKKGKKEFFDE